MLRIGLSGGDGFSKGEGFGVGHDGGLAFCSQRDTDLTCDNQQTACHVLVRKMKACLVMVAQRHRTRRDASFDVILQESWGDETDCECYDNTCTYSVSSFA